MRTKTKNIDIQRLNSLIRSKLKKKKKKGQEARLGKKKRKAKTGRLEMRWKTQSQMQKKSRECSERHLQLWQQTRGKE